MHRTFKANCEEIFKKEARNSSKHRNNLSFFLMEPAIIQQYQHTYEMIHSESSKDNKMQEEILKISKNKS